VEVLACGHVAHSGTSLVCRHLAGPAEGDDIAYVRLLTGHGLDYDLCCTACDTAIAAGAPADLVQVCEGCVGRYDDQEAGYLSAWRGTPGVLERPEPVDPTVVETPLPAGLGTVVDLAPVIGRDRSRWLVLTEAGHLVRLDADTGESTVVATTDVPAEPGHEPWAGQDIRRRLHASPDGRVAAVVNDFGRHGRVFDLDTGAVTLVLNGGDHHSETVPFSVALVHHRGRHVVVHRTAWNRLDASDALTGRLLTARGPTGYRHGEPRPEHYLDYFHGALHASPTGRWLADDGWVWHPIGIPSVWDLPRWLDGNVWESEDGPSRADLCHRDYHWNVAMCWIGADLLAIGGIGDDDATMLPGARVFDVTTGVQRNLFPGPHGAFFAAAGRLFAAAPDGLGIWDPASGHRTGRVPGFVPTHHHPGSGELVAVRGAHLLRWRVDPARRAGASGHA
jgi:hypothetical protein